MSVSGLGSSVAGWAADASAGDNLILASRTATGAFAAETATTTPTIGLLGGLFPQVFAAADGDGSGIVVYFDDSPGDGDLSLIARDPGGSPNKWGAPTAISGTSAIGSAGLFANPSGDAILVWTIGSANHAAFRARDTTAFGADDPLPNGNVVSVAVQADGAVLAVVVSAGDATLYRRPAGGTGWTAISGPHTLNSLSGAGDAVVAASRTGDKVAFAWTQKPADVGTQAYRIWAQVGTASDLGTPTTLPGQPATPGQSDPNPNHNELPAVAVDPSGNAAAVWRGYRSSSDPGLGLVFAALFDAASTTTPPGDPGASPPPGGTPPPADGAGTPPPGTPPAEDPVERLLGLRPPRTIPAGNGISVPVFCIPSNVNGCNGAIGAVISGSYRPGGPVFSSRRLKVKRFTYRLRPAAFSLRAGQRRTIKVKYPPAVRRAIRTALRHRGGRVTATVQATLRGRKSRKFVLRLKR